MIGLIQLLRFCLLHPINVLLAIFIKLRIGAVNLIIAKVISVL